MTQLAMNTVSFSFSKTFIFILIHRSILGFAETLSHDKLVSYLWAEYLSIYSSHLFHDSWILHMTHTLSTNRITPSDKHSHTL